MGDIVTSSSIKMAGNNFDSEILSYVKKQYKLLIGERTSEEIKINIGTVFPGARNEEMDIRGRDMVTGSSAHNYSQLQRNRKCSP